jgi:hypothetical protein
MCPDVSRFLTLIVKSLSNLDLTTVHIGFLILEMIHILNNFNFYFIHINSGDIAYNLNKVSFNKFFQFKNAILSQILTSQRL